MTSIKLAIRKLFRRGEHTITRILSLALGLAFGIVLLSEVFFYFSYDSFFPDANRIFIVIENFKMDNQSEKLTPNPRVSGAIGPGLKAEVPGIEAATRLNSIGDLEFFSEQNNVYSGHVVLADDQLFEVLPRPIIQGLGVETLKSPMMCIVSSAIAEKMGGNVVGHTIELKDYPGKPITICGVFEKYPENTNYKYDIAISMVSTSNFMWDGTENWLGNDRYYTCVKLEKGVSPASLAPAVRQMQEKHQEIEKYEAQGFVLKYSFEPIRRLYANEAKDLIIILSAVTAIVLLISVLNYILLTASTLVNRAKSSASLKCYGAENRNLLGVIFAESFLIFAISLAMAAGLILMIKPVAEVQLGHSLNVLLNPQVYMPVMLIVTILIIPIGYFPGRSYARTPVAVAFRTYHQKKTGWKKALLAFQFAGVSLFIALLVVVSLLYSKVLDADHGYKTDNVFYASVSGMNPHKIQTVLNELMALSDVEHVALGIELPIDYPSGNNVLSPDGERDLFNVADMYYIDHEYFSVLGIPITSGSGFIEGKSVANEIVVSQKCADLLVLNNGWNDGIVGQSVTITEHHNVNTSSRISGIYPNLAIGTVLFSDTRPSVFFYWPRQQFIDILEQRPDFSFNILIKTFPGIQADINQKLTTIINSAMLRGQTEVESLELALHKAYQPAKSFRNAIYAGSAIVLLISLMGLLGYLSEEITRQRKSLAIRKINGASNAQIVKIFVSGLAKLAIPFVSVGLIGAWYLSGLWMENFSIKFPLHWCIFVLSGLCILIIVGVTAVIKSLGAALKNPVEALRYE